jgi:hypothetical protein
MASITPPRESPVPSRLYDPFPSPEPGLDQRAALQKTGAYTYGFSVGIECWPSLNRLVGEKRRWDETLRDNTPDPGGEMARSRRPFDRHFSWQHAPTLNQFPKKQTCHAALRVHKNQMITAHLSGSREYLLNGLAWRPQRYKVRLVNHARTVYGR